MSDETKREPLTIDKLRALPFTLRTHLNTTHGHVFEHRNDQWGISWSRTVQKKPPRAVHYFLSCDAGQVEYDRGNQVEKVAEFVSLYNGWHHRAVEDAAI